MRTLAALFLVFYVGVGLTNTVPGFLVRGSLIAVPLYWCGMIEAETARAIILDAHL